MKVESGSIGVGERLVEGAWMCAARVNQIKTQGEK
jgi:hypothetical protein